MAVIKKHWLKFLVGTVLVVAGLAWATTLMLSGPARAQQGQEAPKLDAVAYGELSSLRERLCLRNEDLAAMGFTQASAETVLTTLRTWYEAKRAELAQAREGIADRQKELRQALCRMNAGPRDEQLLSRIPQLQEDLARAEKDLNDLILTAQPQVEMTLSQAQGAMWEAARQNQGVPSGYRYVSNLTEEQRKALHLCLRTRARKTAAANTSDESTAASAAFRTAEDGILSFGQKSAQSEAMGNMRTSMAGVLAASEKVLPVPEELKPKALPEPLAQGQ